MDIATGIMVHYHGVFASKVWNAISGDEIHSFPHKHIVKCVEFTDNSSQLLTGSNEKLLRIYDLNRPDAGYLALCLD